MISLSRIIAAINNSPTANALADALTGSIDGIITSTTRSPLKALRAVGVWGMERYLALEPLTDLEHFGTICLIPVIFGLAFYINFLP